MTWPTVQDVHKAAKACGHKKRSRPDAIAFRARYGEEVVGLLARLHSGQYQPGPGVRFATERPKNREIHAAHFRDRVVHHLLHDQLEPKFEPAFINDSYACRKGKGTLAAVDALHKKMRDVTRNGQVRAYALQLDIKSFFPSLHKPTLWKLLESQFEDDEKHLRTLTRTILEHRPELNAISRGPKQLFAKIPPHKILGALGANCGLPIGNLTSQFFANVYLNVLDLFVKRTLGVRHYVRYVDDLILLHNDRPKLLEWEKEIRSFLRGRLSLEMHDPKMFSVGGQGVDFLGYVVRPNYRLVRHRVIARAKERIFEKEKAVLEFNRSFEQESKSLARFLYLLRKVPNARVWPISCDAIEELRATWASYIGHCIHADSRALITNLWLRHPVSQFYLEGLDFSKKGYGLQSRFSKDMFDDKWSTQIQRLRSGINNAVFIVQVGRYFQVPLRKDIHVLNLGPDQIKCGRIRPGVPFWRSLDVIYKCLNKNRAVAVALEEPGSTGPVKPRFLALLVEPLQGRSVVGW